MAEGPYGMSVDLNRINEGGQIPAGAEIKIVNDEQGVQDCAEVIINGYGFPPDWKGLPSTFYSAWGWMTPIAVM